MTELILFLTLILHIQWDDTAAKDTKVLIDELKLNLAVVESSKDQLEEASSGSKLYTDPIDDTQYEWDVKEEHGFLKRANKTNLYF